MLDRKRARCDRTPRMALTLDPQTAVRALAHAHRSVRFVLAAVFALDVLTAMIVTGYGNSYLLDTLDCAARVPGLRARRVRAGEVRDRPAGRVAHRPRAAGRIAGPRGDAPDRWRDGDARGRDRRGLHRRRRHPLGRGDAVLADRVPRARRLIAAREPRRRERLPRHCVGGLDRPRVRPGGAARRIGIEHRLRHRDRAGGGDRGAALAGAPPRRETSAATARGRRPRR